MTIGSALITRKALNPYEEATAVKAMLDRGFSEEGAAHLLGWDRRRVTARVKLLELPERAQQLVGDGTIALSTQLTGTVRTLDTVSAYDLIIAHRQVDLDTFPTGGFAARHTIEALAAASRGTSE